MRHSIHWLRMDRDATAKTAGILARSPEPAAKSRMNQCIELAVFKTSPSYFERLSKVTESRFVFRSLQVNRSGGKLCRSGTA
jgi:hypothetical protein